MPDDWLIKAMDDPAVTDGQLTEYIRGHRTVHLGGLTEADRILIRRLYASGALNQYQLAELFGVTQPNISRIVRHKQTGDSNV